MFHPVGPLDLRKAALSDPTGSAVIGAQNMAVLTIQDGGATVSFGQNYGVSEKEGTAKIELVRHRDTSGSFYEGFNDQGIVAGGVVQSDGRLIVGESPELC